MRLASILLPQHKLMEAGGASVALKFQLLQRLTGAPGEIRTPDPQIRSLVLYSGAAICLIIPCSTAPTLSNNIIQKGLAFGRDWSGSVVNSGR